MTEISEQIIKFGGLTPIIEMVSSEHDIMQNEALIALAFMSSTLKGETFIEALFIWEKSNQNLVLSNELMRVELPP